MGLTCTPDAIHVIKVMMAGYRLEMEVAMYLEVATCG